MGTPARLIKRGKVVGIAKTRLTSLVLAAAILPSVATLVVPVQEAAAQTWTGSVAYPDEVLADGPVLHWRLGETPGAATAEDASSNDRDGAYNGTPGYHTAGGPSDLAPGITLSGDDYVDRASEAATNFERTDPFTLEAWFRHGAMTSAGAESLFGKMLGSPSFRGYDLAMIGTADSTNVGRLRFHLINQNDTGNKIFVRTNLRFDDGKWHHAVVTYTGSSTAAGVRIYVDGALAATTVEFDALSATTQSAARLRAGSRTGAGDAILAPSVGDVDELAVYPAALSATRIAAHYDAAVMPPPSQTNPTVSNLAPAGGVTSATSAPTLSAIFNDPSPGDDGYVEFEVYKNESLVATNAAGAHTFVQPGQTSSWQVPAGALQGNGTYTWRARAFDGDSYSQWTSRPASRALTIGGTFPTVDQWSADQGTGRVGYGFKVGASGLNVPGDIAGPCYQIDCSWRVEARYSNGTVEKGLGVIASGALASNTPSMSETVTGILSMEVTDIRTIVDPGPCVACSQARTRYDSGWTRVGEPYASGGISLHAKAWERDTASGTYAYELTVTGVGAAQTDGPCHEKPCQWRVEARYDNGFVATLGSKQHPAGTWGVNEAVYGTTIDGKITELSATLESMCAVTAAYWCWDPYESYTTGWIEVSDSMLDNQDLVGYEVALAGALVANPSTFCDRLAVAGGALPSTDEYSPPDAWQRCWEAVQLYGPNIRKVLLFVAGAAGGAKALDMLLDEHANDGPVPTPEGEATPAPPWSPPDSWEDNGCYWQSIQYTANSEKHLKENGHIYEFRTTGKSWFYPWVTPNLKSLAETHALSVMPVPDPTNARMCRRVVTHLSRAVGIDRDTHQPTHVYTVITWRESGEVRTMFPGLP